MADAAQLKIINASSTANADALNNQLNRKQVYSNTSGLGLQIVTIGSTTCRKYIFQQQNDNQIAALIQFKN